MGRVKDTMVSGNVCRALNILLVVGSQGRWLGGGTESAPIACHVMAVATKS